MNFDELPAEIQQAYNELNARMKADNGVSPNRIKRHIPGFIEHDETDLVEVEFRSLTELLNIEWVKRWDTDALVQFSARRDGRRRPALMAEMKSGDAWCLGWLWEDVPELPSWDKAATDARKAARLAR